MKIVMDDTHAVIEGIVRDVEDEDYGSHDVKINDTTDYGKSLIHFILALAFVKKGNFIRVTIEKADREPVIIKADKK